MEKAQWARVLATCYESRRIGVQSPVSHVKAMPECAYLPHQLCGVEQRGNVMVGFCQTFFWEKEVLFRKCLHDIAL